jgi:hypothetical protein
VIVAGDFDEGNMQSPLGWVDFGTGGLLARATSAFVVKLDAKGNTIWDKVYSSTSVSGFDMVEDVAVDGTGNVVAVVDGDSSTDFGAGPVGSADGGASSDRYLVKLGPDGGLAFVKPSVDLAPSRWNIDSVDTTRGGSIWLAGTDGAGNASPLRATRLDPNGTQVWSQVVPAQTAPAWNGVAVRVGPADDAVVSAASPVGTSGTDWNRWNEGLSPAGDVLWTRPSVSLSGTPWNPAELVRLDSARNTWMSGQFTGNLVLGPPVGTITSPPGVWSASVTAYGVAGDLRSASVWSGAPPPTVGDMALDATGHVILAGWASGSTNTLVVVKLGF